ncbi:hypothetical protein [Corallococcus sp. AB045]|uniref:DUF7716 domain-containing protein n=1 Tax=Corallococcus sp. AB045 TaxID=2316719 RepID=UPI0011C38EC5|nr:hypothetical protein [Corallococcus sp. AB045]
MESFEWLANVLARIDAYPVRGHALYIRDNHPLGLRTPTLVLQRDVYSDELPELACKHGLHKALSVADTRSIVANARLQKEDASPAELVEAFNFYWKHDAFIDLSPGAERPPSRRTD